MFAIDCCISINADFKSITYYTFNKKKKNIIIERERFRTKAFEDDFYEILNKSVALRYKKARRYGRVSLILPDTLFLTDNIKIPIIQKKAMATSLGLAIDALYNNSREIKFSTSFLARDKKTATFGLVGVRKTIIAKLTEAIERAGAGLHGISFGANSCVAGATALNSKLKSGTFVFIDIKQDYTSFSFVVRGNTIGYYSLPFGYDVIKNDEIKDEVTFFDHAASDFILLRAQEEARRQQNNNVAQEVDESDNDDDLDYNDYDDDDEYNDDEEIVPIINDEEEIIEIEQDDDEMEQEGLSSVKIGTVSERLNRRLPKFMRRRTPETPEEFEYENFRVFVKWTLELIRNNSEALASNYPDSVIVNMPERFNHVLERVNLKQERNKVVFQPYTVSKQNEKYKENLELFGGAYIKKYSKNNCF